MADILDKIVFFFRSFDLKLVDLINNFLKPYGIPPNPPYFTARLTFFVRIVIYLTALIIPLSIIKIFFIGYRKFTMLLVTIIIIVGLAVAAIFLGFFQLLYSF